MTKPIQILNFIAVLAVAAGCSHNSERREVMTPASGTTPVRHRTETPKRHTVSPSVTADTPSVTADTPSVPVDKTGSSMQPPESNPASSNYKGLGTYEDGNTGTSDESDLIERPRE